MKTIVLVHGAWLDASSWDKVIPALKAAGHEVINVNLPGMGKTLFLDNEGAINAIRESQHRMQAMSLIPNDFIFKVSKFPGNSMPLSLMDRLI